MLELRNVSFKVSGEDGEKEILKNVSLKIEDRFVAITGPNGGGKSTLAKVIAGIYPVTSGQILFDGVDITNMSITDRAKLGISYAFQTPVRFKGLKVKNLLSTAQKTNSKIMDMCNYLSKVGLCARDYIDRELDDKLSGGELKRIEIATTFARGAKLNIFDEPEAGIDLWSFDGLISAFMENKKDGGTNIIISHQEKILEVADKIVVMNNSTILKVGDGKSILPEVKSIRVCSRLQGESYE